MKSLRSHGSSIKRTLLLVHAGIGLFICLAACQAFKVPGTAIHLPSPTMPQKTPTASQTAQPGAVAVVSAPSETSTASPEPATSNLTATDNATLTAWPTKVFTPSLGPTPTHTPTATFTPTITNTPSPPLASLRLIRSRTAFKNYFSN